MSRHRLFLDRPLAPDSSIELDEEQAHYVSRVLRLKAGANLTLFAGDGKEFSASIIESRKNHVVLQTGNAAVTETESPLRLTLVQGISRGERMDFAVQKSTELGVRRIVPVLTAFSVVKLSGTRAARRQQHWLKVARSACEQCGRNRVPEVADPVSLAAYLGEPSPADLRLAFVPEGGTDLAEIGDVPASIDVLIGPEGGFSSQEITDAKVAGFQPVSLGPRVLRAETAAVAALAVLQSRWGDL